MDIRHSTFKLLAGTKQALSAARLIGLAWITGRKRVYWHLARRELNNLSFRAEAKIKPIRLEALIARLDPAGGLKAVQLPQHISFPGSDDTAYYYSLACLVAALSPEAVIEIGTFKGRGTLTLAMNTGHQSRIFTMDLPDDVNVHEMASLDANDAKLVVDSRSRVGEAFRAHPLGKKITQIRADSLKVTLKDHIHMPIDFAFIDGGHSYEIVKRDTENVLSLLASSKALVIWDDYWWFYPDVVKFLDEVSLKLSLFRIEGTNLVIHIRE